MRKIGFPTRNEVLEGEALELLAVDALRSTSVDGVILEDDAQGIGRQVLPGAIFEAVEVFEQTRGVDLGRVVLQGEEFADVRKQLQTSRGGGGLFGGEYPEKREQGLVCPSLSCGPGDSQQGQESVEARASEGPELGIGEILEGQVADELGILVDPGSKGLADLPDIHAKKLMPIRLDSFARFLAAKDDGNT